MSNPVLSLRGLGARVTENAPMVAHTTFKIGGPARFLVQADPSLLPEALLAARACGLPLSVIGNGSNLLASDRGVAGVIFRLEPECARVDGCAITASAGAPLAAVASLAAREGLTGLEFAHGIPGSVGGGIYMNAGAYGGQMSDVLHSCGFIDVNRAEPEERELTRGEMAFGYRQSVFRANPNWIITRARFELKRGDSREIEQKMRELAAARREKQPLEYPSAGSVYKRPEGHFAGKLIEDCGLKGFAIGGAQVSEKHAGFIINRGGATCRDTLALMEHVEGEVEKRFGVRLEREVRIIGEL